MTCSPSAPSTKRVPPRASKARESSATPTVQRPDVEVCRPPYLHVVKKRIGPAAAAAAPMGNPSCLLYLVDVASSKRYLVDFGSAFSILPHKSTAEPTGPRLMTVDGKPLHCWGHRTCTVHTRTRQFSWSFLLAPVAFPILAADFLSKFKLLVDISNKRLVARGSQLIQLEPGRPTKAAVVTGVVAATRAPAVVPSPPSHPTVEAPPTTPSLHTVEAPSSRPPPRQQAARRGSQAAQSSPTTSSGLFYTISSHSGGTQQWFQAVGSHPACRGGQEASHEVPGCGWS